MGSRCIIPDLSSKFIAAGYVIHSGCCVTSCFAHSRRVCSASAIFWIFGDVGGVLWFGEDGGVDSADEFGCVSGSVSLEKIGFSLVIVFGGKGEEDDPEAS